MRHLHLQLLTRLYLLERIVLLPSTELMGLRRLTLNELLNLDVGSFFLLSIPPDSRLEDKDTIKLRSAFKPSYLSLFSRSLVFYMSFY
jgi:hypothetical protein